MPSKKRKYNARFPAGRIKKIMQTDEEVGKVAQAVPIIILFGATPRTLELFVESLMNKAMQVTMARNAKTLSPSHVKQCILAESRFDFLRDLVKNIPDVSAAEEKEMMSAESSPNSSRFSENSVPPRKIVREDSNSSSSCEVRVQTNPRENVKRALSAESELPKPRIETVTSAVLSNEAIDLTTKKEEDKPVRTANFYQETLLEPVPVPIQHRSVITVNPTYSSPQPSTSTYANMTPIEPVQRVEIVPKPDRPLLFLDVRQNNNVSQILTPTPRTPVTPIRSPINSIRAPVNPIRAPVNPIRAPVNPIRAPVNPIRTPVTPILNIDFSKNLTNPKIKVLDTAVANIVGVKNDGNVLEMQMQSSNRVDVKKDSKVHPIDIDHINSGNLQIDEDYDT